MKKRIHIILIITFLLISFLHITIVETDSGDVSSVLGEEFNISADDIPTDPEELRQRYLQQQWTGTIANNTILGPIHRTFEKGSVVFQILFAHPYEISLTLFGILVLWFLIAFQSAKVIESWGFLKGWKAVTAGLALAVILAQTRILKGITTGILDLIFKPENWWMRLIIGIIAITAIGFLFVLSRMLSQHLKKRQQQQREEKSEQQLKKITAVTEGVKKYRQGA